MQETVIARYITQPQDEIDIKTLNTVIRIVDHGTYLDAVNEIFVEMVTDEIGNGNLTIYRMGNGMYPL